MIVGRIGYRGEGVRGSVGGGRVVKAYLMRLKIFEERGFLWTSVGGEL